MKNIFVFALEEFNHRLLRTVRDADQYRFHPLLGYSELVAAKSYDMPEIMARAEKILTEFEGTVDGLISYWDFPSSTMAPILRKKLGLPGPSVESVLKCEHKYWSRLVQREVIPELVPRFCAVDPFAENVPDQIDLKFPYWIKPVQAHSSYLGFKIENEDDLSKAVSAIRQNLHRFAEPYNYLSRYADLPEAISRINGYHCVAEEMISADEQCTLEGYVRAGKPRVYGVVDSLRAEGGSSFTRYQYPSKLPREVQQRMIEAADSVMRHIGLDRSTFDIEFFYNPQSERLNLLEINPRLSKSHCPLFYYVEGVSHQEVDVDLIADKDIDFPHGEGDYSIAAKFMLRRFEDARVARVPDEKQIDRVHEEVPGIMFRLEVEKGDLLSDLEDQDSYSYQYGVVFVGGHSQEELERKYEKVMDLLPFEFEPVEGEID